MSRPLDVDRESLRALEFDDLLEHVAGFATTVPGRRRVLRLQPRTEPEWIRSELATVGEVRRLLASEGRLVSALPDPEPALRVLAVSAARVEAVRLRDLAVLLVAAADCAGQLTALDEREYPHLTGHGRGMPDLARESRDITRYVDSDGHLADEASPELARLRRERARLGARVRCTLEELLRGPEADVVFQDDFITRRNERYVVPVRTDTPRRVEGIIHAASSSGATRFVEPLETVELNNDLVRLAESEQEEQERVIAGWSEGLRRRLGEARLAVDGLAALDALQARAFFAEDADAVAPAVDSGGVIELQGVRHPLLDLLLRERGERCVPLELALDPADRVLVISGPNAGGKTVALKTFGLAVLMAQSGIPVSAVSVRLPLYRQLRADIGDHQSIEANLSTFSAHVRAVAGFLEDACSPALFLFDEIGTGTEPAEGAALAIAVLEALQAPGVTSMATTHQGALKAWSMTTDGAATAALDFDTEQLRPTFRILMGTAGDSAGLEIAERLGLPRRVVERARERLDPGSREGRRYLEKLRALTVELEGRQAELGLREREIEEAERARVARAEEAELERRKRAGRALDDALAEFRAEARRVLGGVRDAREKARVEKAVARAQGRLGGEIRRHKAVVAPDDGEAADWAPAECLEVGMEVLVRSLGKHGTVVALRGQRVEVRLGRMPFTVTRDDLRVRAGKDGAATPARPAPQTVSVEATAVGVPPEIKLIGLTVEEGLDELDRFLDRAVVAGHPSVRVVHGHGTGRLREAVRRFLADHPSAASWRSGGKGEGGDGATVVELA